MRDTNAHQRSTNTHRLRAAFDEPWTLGGREPVVSQLDLRTRAGEWSPLRRAALWQGSHAIDAVQVRTLVSAMPRRA